MVAPTMVDTKATTATIIAVFISAQIPIPSTSPTFISPLGRSWVPCGFRSKWTAILSAADNPAVCPLGRVVGRPSNGPVQAGTAPIHASDIIQYRPRGHDLRDSHQDTGQTHLLLTASALPTVS